MNTPINDRESQVRAKQAYARLKPELGALFVAELLPFNVNAAKTVQLVLEVVPRLRALGPDLDRTLPTFDQRLFDKLEACALALSAIEDEHAAAQTEERPTRRLLEQASYLRTLLMSDASALCKRGFISPRDLGRVRGLRGYENTARDLATIAAFLRPLWPKISGKCAVTLTELDLATELVGKLRLTGSLQDGAAVALVDEARRRAFTLLYATYTEVRRSIGYLRAAEGDVDVLMPFLCGRPRRV